jgi:demethylmenaquinone methyltransferase/2-methoxy-6-polyprenyl-1,4-benzoquinol methylase
MDNVDYDMWIDYIHKLWNKYQVSPKLIAELGCGTGNITERLAEKGYDMVGIDISEEMVKIAQSKFPQVNVLCGDVENAVFPQKFDCIVVYNAFPHFPNPETLISVLAGHLAPGGLLTVAHGMSRAAIDRHHEGAASRVSLGLMHEDSLAELFSKYLTVTVKHADDSMYQITGRKE